MREAINQYEFLTKNLPIIWDLRILEDKLVQAGLLTPDEVFEKTSDELFDN